MSHDNYKLEIFNFEASPLPYAAFLKPRFTFTRVSADFTKSQPSKKQLAKILISWSVTSGEDFIRMRSKD